MEPERGQADDTVAEGEQTLLLLTPFTTNAPVAGGDLADYLQEESPYRPFAQHLQRVKNAVSHKEIWGGVVPALTVLQGGLEKVYSRNYRNGKTGKLLPSIANPMVEYISAFKFYDSVARIECQERISRDVLKQPQRKGYIGEQRHMKGIANLRKLIEDVLKAGDAYCQLVSSQQRETSTPATTVAESSQRTAAPPTGNADPLFMIARELTDVSSAKGALKIIRNLSAVALSIRVLMQGTCLSVPDSYETLVQKLPPNLRPSTDSQKEELTAATSDPRGLRQAFYLAVLISPLLAVLAGTELQKYPACFEEILVNSKRIGNDKPLAISRLEDQVLVEVLRIAEGGQTSISAFLNLYRSWKQSPPEFTLEENGFFDRPQSMENSRITRAVSVFETPAVVPYPEAWPLSQKGWGFVRAETALPRSQAPTTSSSTTSEDPKGKGREPLQEAFEEHRASVDPRKGDDDDEDEDEDDDEDKDKDDDDRIVNANNNYNDANPGSSGTNADPASPRRSNRERKEHVINPGPSSKSAKPKVQKRSRKRPREATVDANDQDEIHSIPAIREFHAKGIKRRQAIIEESIVKMEGVEPQVISEVGEGTLPLNVDEEVTRFSDSETYLFDLWDAEGTSENIRLEGHLESDFRSWQVIIEAAKAQHCESGRPRFLDDPDNSILRVFPKTKYAPQFADLVQRAFGKQCLVVPRFVERDRASSFDPEGLEEVCDVNHKTAVQDFSAPESMDLNDRVRLGNLNDVYRSSIAPGNKRKILNALFFPHHNGTIDSKDPISSDARAWFKTHSELHCFKQLPIGDMRWHIVGTTGASHYFHVDPRGDGTFVLVRVGMKAWALAVPIDESVMSSAELWTKLERDITKRDFKKWKIEIILLRPGDLLLQWPHVSHAVYTPLNAICKGGHFIAVATLRRTLLGMIHTFFCSGITNIDHPTFTGRINSLVCFFYKAMTVDVDTVSKQDSVHLPDIHSVAGILDILLLTCVVEVQNALCPSSYAVTDDCSLVALLANHGHTPLQALIDFDISSMSHEMRAQNVFSRGRMQALLRHIFNHRVTISKPNGEEMRDPWGQLFIPTFAWFINCLKTYLTLSLDNVQKPVGRKRIRDLRPLTHTPGTATDESINFKALFNVQLRSSSLRWEPLTDAVKKIQQQHKLKSKKIVTFLPPDIHTSFTVTKKACSSNNQDAGARPDPNFRELGTRTLDSTYFTKYAQLVGFDGASDPISTGFEGTSRKRRRVGGTT